MPTDRSLTLDELKARGAAAFEETRRMIDDLQEMADASRRAVTTLGRFRKARLRTVVREYIAHSAKS